MAGHWEVSLTAWFRDVLNEVVANGELVEQAGGMSASDVLGRSKPGRWVAGPASLGTFWPKTLHLVRRQEGCFMPNQQKSCWIFTQRGKGLDLAAVGIVKVCITMASFKRSDFLHGAVLQLTDFINNHVFFSRHQVMAPGGVVQLYDLYKLL